MNRAGCTLAALFLLTASARATDMFPPPPGPYVGARAPDGAIDFRSGEPIVGTYYFYWYDIDSKAHFIDGDGTDALTRHPAITKGYSYKSATWHAGELRDMLAAGIDFALPVFWGYPGHHDQWSFTGLPPLVEAARRLESRGARTPRIGCFFDTSTLRHNRESYHADMRTERGREWLYVTVRDFYSLVPPDLRATIDGRPIVWLYAAGFAKAQDPASFDHFRKRFEADFGVAPYLVKEVSWEGQADATYAWGAALAPKILDVAAVGPGYDHSAVPGRAPLVRDRENGAFYRRSWESVLALPADVRPWISVVETWNEWHEGTDIAPSVESGRKYVELTREYADRWHAREIVVPRGYGDPRREVSITLGASNESSGLVQNEEPDGRTHSVEREGRAARATSETEHAGRYMYFDVEDEFFFAGRAPLEVEVTFFDAGKAPLALEYDSTDRSAHMAGAFKPAPGIPKTGTESWRIARFRLPDAAFVGRANRNDFRLVDSDAGLIVAEVKVKKLNVPREGIVMPGELVPVNDDGGWCWFEDERAIVVGDRIIVGTVSAGRHEPSRRGNIEVSAYEVPTRRLSRLVLHEQLQLDDHDSPAFVVRGDGRLLAMWSRHGNDNTIHFRISETPVDPTQWRPRRSLVPSERSRVTYSNLFRLSAENNGRGRLYNFYRGFDDSFKPSWMASDDDGETWKQHGVLIDMPSERRHRPYVKYASNGRDAVHFVFTEGHPHVYDNSIYHAVYRGGALWRSDGTRIGSVTSGPLTPDDATRVFHGDADNVAWTSDLHLDASDLPVAVYSVQKGGAGISVGNPGAGQDHRYRYARWDGNRWIDNEIARAGTRLYRGQDDYTGTICINPDNVNEVFFSSNVQPRTGEANRHGRYEIWRGRTGDLGRTWKLEPVTKNSPADNLRPIVPLWKKDRTALLWLRGTYRTYTNYDLEVVGYLLDN